MSIVERAEYKGKPTLVMKRTEDDKFPFAFGISKAKLILENIEKRKKMNTMRNFQSLIMRLPLAW